ncbi:MAG: hypothetical protein IK104_03635 [Clostridia bacterium]|nr:hypothetical protein [Clostridia bacterium]
MLPPQIRTEKLGPDFFSDDEGVTCMCRHGDALFVGAERGLYRFCHGERLKFAGFHNGVSALASDGGRLFVATGSEVRVFGVETEPFRFEAPVRKLAAGGEAVYALTDEALFRLENGAFVPVQGLDFPPRDLTVTPAGVAWVLCERSLHKLFAKRERFGTRFSSLTRLPDVGLRCVRADGLGMLWIGTDDGLWLYDGLGEWIGPDAIPQFPRCQINDISFGETAVYASTPFGLYAVNGEETAFYGRGRYLTCDQVRCAAEDADAALYIGTPEGMSVLSFEPMPLAAKEAYFRSLLPFFTREDYVTRRIGTEDGDLATGTVQITDNDGLYTADRVTFESIRYHLTGAPDAKESAAAAMRAMWKLETVSGIPGFPARAYRRPGEDRFGNGDPEWHLTSDEKGPLEWKGETSSDELTGHFWASAWYYDLAADDAEKETVRTRIAEIADHILTHGFTLCDADGTPTSWAHFGPGDLNDDESWCFEKGVNALEILGFLLVAHHVTGDEKYLAVRKDLISRHHYALNMLCYKKDDAHSNHIDERLTAYAGTCLLRYETDPALLRFYRLALRRHYEYVRDEGYSYLVFLWAAANACDTDTDLAKRALAEYPIDLRYYKTDLSVRPDAPPEPRAAAFGEEPHAAKPFRVPERITTQTHEGANEYFCGRDNAFLSPCTWLAAYWLGRYFGFITEAD